MVLIRRQRLLALLLLLLRLVLLLQMPNNGNLMVLRVIQVHMVMRTRRGRRLMAPVGMTVHVVGVQVLGILRVQRRQVVMGPAAVLHEAGHWADPDGHPNALALLGHTESRDHSARCRLRRRRRCPPGAAPAPSLLAQQF